MRTMFSGLYKEEKGEVKMGKTKGWTKVVKKKKMEEWACDRDESISCKIYESLDRKKWVVSVIKGKQKVLFGKRDTKKEARTTIINWMEAHPRGYKKK